MILVAAPLNSLLLSSATVSSGSLLGGASAVPNAVQHCHHVERLYYSVTTSFSVAPEVRHFICPDTTQKWVKTSLKKNNYNLGSGNNILCPSVAPSGVFQANNPSACTMLSGALVEEKRRSTWEAACISFQPISL